MFEYKATEKFDIGAGHGRYEYDFFAVNGEDDFWALVNYYAAVYGRFDYFPNRYEVIKNNTRLSPVVQAKMEEHDANFCLTLLEERFNENNVGIRQMIVNEQKPDEVYTTYIFNLYHFAIERAGDHFERGHAYAKSNLHKAAIIHYSHAIKLDPGMRDAVLFRGASYLYTKEYNRAIEDFTQGINFNAEKSDSYALRGLAYKIAGDFDKARMDIAQALELDPDDEVVKACLEQFNRA